jgi:metal-responsive CopG/Arc/MetJ family transcriptional regulator
MKRFQMFFPEPLLKRLMEYAQKHDYSIADVVRRAVLKFLDDEDAKERKQK